MRRCRARRVAVVRISGIDGSWTASARTEKNSCRQCKDSNGHGGEGSADDDGAPPAAAFPWRRWWCWLLLLAGSAVVVVDRTIHATCAACYRIWVDDRKIHFELFPILVAWMVILCLYLTVSIFTIIAFGRDPLHLLRRLFSFLGGGGR